MPGLLPTIVERISSFRWSPPTALNHMSRRFRGVMQDISAILKEVYRSQRSAGAGQRNLWHGKRWRGSFAPTGRRWSVRSGWFSYRGRRSLTRGASSVHRVQARPLSNHPQAPWVRLPDAGAAATIRQRRLMLSSHRTLKPLQA